MNDLISEKAASVPLGKSDKDHEGWKVTVTADSIEFKVKENPMEETNSILGKIAGELHKLNWYVQQGYFRK